MGPVDFIEMGRDTDGRVDRPLPSGFGASSGSRAGSESIVLGRVGPTTPKSLVEGDIEFEIGAEGMSP